MIILGQISATQEAFVMAVDYGGKKPIGWKVEPQYYQKFSQT